MAKKSEISSKKLPPHTKDIEVNRALTQVYKDINELVESVNLFKGKEADDNSEGKEGDVKVVKSPQSKEYSLQIYGEDGWLEDKTAKYVPINALVDIKQEQKKKTIPSHLGGLLAPPDYDSGWVALNHQTGSSPTLINHNLGLSDVPRDLRYYVADSASPVIGTDLILSDNFTWDNSGVMFEIYDSNTLKLWPDNSHIGGMHSASVGPEIEDGWIRVLLWK